MSYARFQDKSYFEQLPSSWKVCKFDTVIKDISAGNKKLKTSEYLTEGLFPIIDQGQNLIAGYTNDQSSLVNAEPPYIVFGDHTRVLKFICEKFAVGADGVKVLKVIKNYCYDKYVYYFLKSVQIPNTGYNRHFKFLKELQIPLPPLHIQKQIAQILDEADALIQKRKQAIAKLDELVQSIFLEMFGDPVTNPKNFPISFVKNVCKKILGGGTPSKQVKEYYSGDVPWVTPKDMKKKFIDDSKDHITEEAINNSSTKLIPANSLLMVIRSGILKNTLPVAINLREVTINQDLKAFVVNKDIVQVEYLLYYFINYQRVLLSKVRGVTANNLEFNQVKDSIIPLPPMDLQLLFRSIVHQVESQKSLMQKQLTKLEENFNSLLQRAFRGELQFFQAGERNDPQRGFSEAISAVEVHS